MNQMSDQAMSRPMGVAESLRGEPLSQADILSRPVLLTGELAALMTANGQWCLLNCLRLLPRIVSPLVISLPPGLGEFEKEVRVLVSEVYTQGIVSLNIDELPSDFAQFAAILNVGMEVHASTPWTTINSNGWIARATSVAGPLPSDMTQPNPIAALMAASIGVAEVFKRVYHIPQQVAPTLELTQFSLYDFSDVSGNPGPALRRDHLLPDTIVVGAGAIGNGLALLLAQLGWQGRVHIIDCQEYAKENLGTCVLLDSPAWLGEAKAPQLADWLTRHSSLVVTGESAPIEKARSGEVARTMTTELVLNGLDDVQARHDTQLLWPATLVDGGINAIGAAVVTHRLDQQGSACLRCAFELPLKNARAVQAAVTGLSFESLEDLGKPLTEDDIELAAEEKRPWLRLMMAEGKTRCATVAEANKLGLEFQPGFRPSVPFIATAAATLVMAEAAKALYHSEAKFTHRFQIESLFRGPNASIATTRPADPSCLCVVGRDVIDAQVKKRQRRDCVTAA